MDGDTLLFALRKHLLLRHSDFPIHFLRGKKVKISEARSHGEGVCALLDLTCRVKHLFAAADLVVLLLAPDYTCRKEKHRLRKVLQLQ